MKRISERAFKAQGGLVLSAYRNPDQPFRDMTMMDWKATGRPAWCPDGLAASLARVAGLEINDIFQDACVIELESEFSDKKKKISELYSRAGVARKGEGGGGRISKDKGRAVDFNSEVADGWDAGSRAADPYVILEARQEIGLLDPRFVIDALETADAFGMSSRDLLERDVAAGKKPKTLRRYQQRLAAAWARLSEQGDLFGGEPA